MPPEPIDTADDADLYALTYAAQAVIDAGGPDANPDQITANLAGYAHNGATIDHDLIFEMIDHWHEARGGTDPDAAHHAGQPFEAHAHTCQVCMYLEAAEGIRRMFTFELCHECALDIEDHTISPDALGLPHAWCQRAPEGE
jgi:hypothetical protein